MAHLLVSLMFCAAGLYALAFIVRAFASVTDRADAAVRVSGPAAAIGEPRGAFGPRPRPASGLRAWGRPPRPVAGFRPAPGFRPRAAACSAHSRVC